MEKGCLAIPQEVGALPEIVVSQNTAGLILILYRRGSGEREPVEATQLRESNEVSEGGELSIMLPLQIPFHSSDYPAR